MEINESPVVFQDVILKYKTARDFTEACAYCLIPLAPRYNNRSLLLCEECEEKWREEKRPAVHDSDDPETPLSSANISLTLADAGDTENCASGQFDKENDLEGLFLRVEKELAREDLNRGMLDANESRSRSRIIEIVKRVLKTCGYVVAAVIGIPLIAGAGAASIVVITIAGAFSPPVILAIAKHRKLTSNQWWTYTRKERYFAIGWGVVVGTLMLPLLAPWGIYKLFKVLGTKLLHNTIYWMKRFDSCPRRFEEEETDENSRDWPTESVDTHRETELLVLDREETRIDGCQSSADPDQIQTETSQPIPPEAVGYNEGLLHEESYGVEENFLDAKRVGVILGSIREEDDDELEDFQDSCHICRGTVWKPGHGRDALSDEENNNGRRDTQRLWARKAVSDTRFDIKIPDEDFKPRELVNGLCVAHQKRDETKDAVNGEENPSLQLLPEWRQWRMAKESRNEDEPGNDVLTKLLQDADQGEEIRSTPQSQEKKDLPEKGPKRTKKRRKRRTDKQLARENLDSSSASEANESLRKEETDKITPKSQLVPETNNNAEAEKGETDLQAEKTTPRKPRKARQIAREIARDKRKTKTKKSKHHEETLPRGGGNEQEEQHTHAGKRQIACRFGTNSPKKDQPGNTDCPKQKSHESQSKHPFTVSSKGAGVDMAPKRRGRLQRMNAFRINMDGSEKLNLLKIGATVMSSTNSEQDIMALYDEID